MVEHVRLTPDGRHLTFSANTGNDALDLERRHAIRVAIDQPKMEILTPGDGLEWTPVQTGDGSAVALISATAERPPLPGVVKLGGSAKTKGAIQLLAQEFIPSRFPVNRLVTPRQVVFKAFDGVSVHADLFEPKATVKGKRAAIVYVHGGPPRQMLLGWHYSDYYSNAYAMNQYLCQLGYVVLAVNYRLGIGYGYDFHQPANAGSFGASEYKDIKGAGEWLAQQPNIDPQHIGIYGGSYGGYLTAMALGRDSKLFAAGVDVHGVHDYVNDRNHLFPNMKFEKAPDLERAKEVAWLSSPISSVSTWTSPVLIIHADDDRNVRFNQSTDLVRRLERKGVEMETLVIVDDTHHWMKFSNAVKLDRAIADFFERKLKR
jgi:dipeptidyl aminopeptidase/acylaminoacyl peptidase